MTASGTWVTSAVKTLFSWSVVTNSSQLPVELIYGWCRLLHPQYQQLFFKYILLNSSKCLGSVHFRHRPYVSGDFLIRNIFFQDSASVHTYSEYPAYESPNFWIRSPEWKFLNTLWIRNRMVAKSGYFLSNDVTRSSPVLYRECLRRCRVYSFFASWTRVSSFITWVQLNQE